MEMWSYMYRICTYSYWTVTCVLKDGGVVSTQEVTDNIHSSALDSKPLLLDFSVDNTVRTMPVDTDSIPPNIFQRKLTACPAFMNQSHEMFHWYRSLTWSPTTQSCSGSYQAHIPKSGNCSHKGLCSHPLRSDPWTSPKRRTCCCWESYMSYNR